MKIFIYLGYPRSASTYMQKNYFSNNKEINYIGRKINYGKEDYNFYNVLEKIIRYSENDFFSNRKKLLLQLKKIKFSKKKKNLIFEEGLLCQFYWRNNDVYRTLTRIISLFDELKIKCNFITTIRNQPECIESIYQYFYSSYFKKNFNSLDNFLKLKKSKNKKILYSFNYLKLFEFFKKRNKKILFLLFEDLKNNEDKIKIKLKNFLDLKYQLKAESKEITNNRENIFFKYKINYKIIIKSMKNLFNFKKYIIAYKKYLRIKYDLYALKNFKLTIVQKKKIYNIYILQNKKLSKYIELNDKYLIFKKN